jgi:16S rRNA (guanine966-N2)-methyltransferase
LFRKSSAAIVPFLSRRIDMTKQSNNKGVFRIIGGRWKGKKMHFVATQGLRPTTDRVRETLFNWLMFDIDGARCLDLFAGSGSVGLEALSRGAEHVDLFEMNRLAAKKLTENAASLEGTSHTVHLTDSIKRLKHGTDLPYDLVFIDPPFRKNLLPDTLSALVEYGWLKSGSLIYLEAEKELNDVELPANWYEKKSKSAGQVSYRLFEVVSD